MRVKGIIASSIRPASAPTVSISSTTNFNQNRATFNGTVSANGAVTTTIKFQISTNGGSTWVDASGGTAITNTSSQGVSVFYNATGLSENTTYTVRLVATNSAGTTNSSTTSFTTWSLKTYTRTASGSDSLTLQTITPTGGSTIAPTIHEVLVGGGGGGGQAGGGGAGGYRALSSITLTSASNLVISISVGGGGGAGVAGGSSSISGNFTTQTAGGGGGGQNNGIVGGNGGSLGTGDVFYSGGVGYGNPDKNNNYDPNNYSYGGGAGWASNGGDGGLFPFTPGNGGSGASIYGINGGAGGRGYAKNGGADQYGSNGTHWNGPSSGGQAFNGSGVAGVVTFKYYGP